MPFTAEKISYKQTNSFSKLVIDYVEGSEDLKTFFSFSPDIDGIENAIKERKNFPVNRELFQQQIIAQYDDVEISDKLKANIDLLINENTFSITTAHQPNIFTGHLYFIYKILHAIKLSDTLNEKFPNQHFVPVYYMGSEDADLQELGEVHINGKHYQWETNQTGAVGRMLIDEAFIKIIDGIEGQLAIEKYGKETIDSIKKYYVIGRTIQDATFLFVHHLFNQFGLITVFTDCANFKNEFSTLIKKELEHQFSKIEVEETVKSFPAVYKVQAAGRDINLFYLKDNYRERIEANGNGYSVTNTNIYFSHEEMMEELKNHPERFSPNVILRPVFQETILPNVAFIGGGGELAYWLELKSVFEASNVFFPVLILRNSFSIINNHVINHATKLGLKNEDYFNSESLLLEHIVRKQSEVVLHLNDEKEALKLLYDKIKRATTLVDTTLNGHIHALGTQAMNKLDIVEKKMLKAEKKKFEAQQRQIRKIKSALFPNGQLQERINNILEYLAVYGTGFINELYNESNSIEPQFTLLKEQ